MQVGALSAGASAEDVARLGMFGEKLGLCFQIKDDIFDYYEDKVIGKPTGNDLREGKITLPLIYAITHGEGSENERMRDLLLSEEYLSSDSVHTLIEYAKTQGGIEYAYETMGRIRNEAVDLLSVFPPSETIDALIAILDYTIERENRIFRIVGLCRPLWALPSYHCAIPRNTYGIRQGERAKIHFEHF